MRSSDLTNTENLYIFLIQAVKIMGMFLKKNRIHTPTTLQVRFMPNSGVFSSETI